MEIVTLPLPTSKVYTTHSRMRVIIWLTLEFNPICLIFWCGRTTIFLYFFFFLFFKWRARALYLFSSLLFSSSLSAVFFFVYTVDFVCALLTISSALFLFVLSLIATWIVNVFILCRIIFFPYENKPLFTRLNVKLGQFSEYLFMYWSIIFYCLNANYILHAHYT